TFAAPTATGQQPAPAPKGPTEIKLTAVLDQPLQVAFLYSINPDCSSIGVARVLTVEEPKHGKLTIEKKSGFTSFPQENPRSACNRRRSEGMTVSYQPEPGYLGADSVALEVIYGDGNYAKRQYAITVGPRPPVPEIARAAVAEQRVRVGFLTNLDPDCTAQPFANVRIV